MATQILGKVAYTSRGAYDSSFSYEINDVVTYNGSSYVSLKETKGNLPTNTEYWMLLAKKGDTYEVTEDDLNNIANQITEEANSSFNQNVDSKTKEFNTNASNKIDDFNSNASSKTETFNTNAVEKTTLFNENATTKLSEYNTNHDTKLETYNTNADERLQEFNDNANSYNERITINAEDIDDNTLRIKRLETDIFDSGEASGNSINIKDSTLAEFQEIIIEGANKQTVTNGNQLIDFTNPKSVSSNITYNFKNDTILASLSEATSGYKAITFEATELFKNNPGKTLSFKDDGYKVDVITADDKLLNPGVQLAINYSDRTDTLYVYLKHFANDNSTAYTIPSDISNIESVRVQIYLNNNKVIADNNLTITKPLLYFDDNDTYEPYTGGQASPSPDYPQSIDVIDEAFELKSCGKNRLDMSKLIATITRNGVTLTNNGDGTFNAKGTASADTNLNIVKDIPTNIIKSGEKYILYSSQQYDVSAFNLSLILNTDIGVKYYAANKISVADFNAVNVANLALYIPSGQTIDVENVKVALYESNTVINEYEPYQESKIEIILPDGEFAGKIDDTSKDQFKIKWNDEDKNYHVYLEKNLHKETFNGTEAWSTLSISGNYKRTSIKLSKKAKIVFESDKRSTGISDYFIVSSHYPNDKPGIFAISTNDNAAYFYPLQDSLDEFKAWLSEHNTTIIYPLAEPYELDLGSVDMLLSYYPVTNVFTDSELNPNINAKYYREFVATIRNLQVNNGTLQSELADVQSRLSALETSLNNLLVSQVESEVVE